MGLRDLVSFMTAIPVGKGSVERAASSFYAVPLIGVIVGGLVGLVGLALSRQPLVAGAIMTALHLLLTGGLHLDGAADYGDLIGSGAKGEEALRVLKDPRRGSFGIATAAVLLIVRFSALSVLSSRPWTVTMAYVASYEAAFIAVMLGRPEPYSGLGRIFWEGSRGRPKLVANALVTAACVVIIVVVSTLLAHASYLDLAALAGLVVGPLTVADAHKRLGFVNGDVLGFTIEVAGVLALVAGALA